MRFQDEYSFLSNFYPCTIIAWGIEFPTSEHAFVAAKTQDTDIREGIALIPTPGGAKRFGRQILLRPDWDTIKVRIMREILRRKFGYEHPDLRKRLMMLEDDIIEHNMWHDNFWGSCVCLNCLLIEGENYLGRLLMEIRDENDED